MHEAMPNRASRARSQSEKESRAKAAHRLPLAAPRFDREERFLLQPLVGRRYTSLVIERSSPTSTRRAPRPMVVVEKRALTAYAQLAGGVA
jgi:hypothetical protein